MTPEERRLVEAIRKRARNHRWLPWDGYWSCEDDILNLIRLLDKLAPPEATA